ncbi:hypothetical protein AOLI_G00311360 [Acnodon oligacanthus]
MPTRGLCAEHLHPPAPRGDAFDRIQAPAPCEPALVSLCGPASPAPESGRGGQTPLRIRLAPTQMASSKYQQLGGPQRESIFSSRSGHPPLYFHRTLRK